MEKPKRSTLIVDSGRAGERLDKLLVSEWGELSRTRVQALVRSGHATVEGRVIVDPGYRVKAGQSLDLSVPDAVDPEPRPEAKELDIVFEDDSLIVLNKPAGLVVHPGAGRESGTLVNALIAHCGASLSGIGGVKRPGIVHRLDRQTSGLLVVAKTDAAHAGLASQFAAHGQDGRLVRSYRGFAWGRMPRPKLTIDQRVGRSSTNRRKMAVVNEPHGRRAVTHLTRVCEYGADDHSVTEFVANLETGRTHQIRVHLLAIGQPLLGDPLYGRGFQSLEAKLPEAVRGALNGLARQALHAEVLGFEHPVTGEALRFQTDLPRDLQALKTALSGRS